VREISLKEGDQMENLTNEDKRLAIINRQPSLWAHSAPGVIIEPADNDEDETIRISPLTIEPMNSDQSDQGRF
jgi:hypothetical protein